MFQTLTKHISIQLWYMSTEQISVAYHKIRLSSEPINTPRKHMTCTVEADEKHEKTWTVSESQLTLVSLLIEWQGGGSFLSQSHCMVM